MSALHTLAAVHHQVALFRLRRKSEELGRLSVETGAPMPAEISIDFDARTVTPEEYREACQKLGVLADFVDSRALEVTERDRKNGEE